MNDAERLGRLYSAILRLGNCRKGQTVTLTYEECAELWPLIDPAVRADVIRSLRNLPTTTKMTEDGPIETGMGFSV